MAKIRKLSEEEINGDDALRELNRRKREVNHKEYIHNNPEAVENRRREAAKNIEEKEASAATDGASDEDLREVDKAKKEHESAHREAKESNRYQSLSPAARAAEDSELEREKEDVYSEAKEKGHGVCKRCKRFLEPGSKCATCGTQGDQDSDLNRRAEESPLAGGGNINPRSGRNEAEQTPRDGDEPSPRGGSRRPGAGSVAPDGAVSAAAGSIAPDGAVSAGVGSAPGGIPTQGRPSLEGAGGGAAGAIPGVGAAGPALGALGAAAGAGNNGDPEAEGKNDPLGLLKGNIAGSQAAEKAMKMAQQAQQAVQAVVQAANWAITALLNPVTWIVGGVIALVILLAGVGISGHQVLGPNPYACKTVEECRALAMCEVSTSSTPVGPITPTLSLGVSGQERRVNLMRQLISTLGITPEQAAGILGNLMQESTLELKPNINQGGALGPPTPVFTSGNAYGWAQWDGGRKQAFVDYAVEKKFVPNAQTDFTDAANISFLLYEVNGSEKASLVALKKTTTAREAARIWRAKFERSAAMEETRYTYSEQALQEYNSGAGSSLPPGPTAPGTPTSTGQWVNPLPGYTSGNTFGKMRDVGTVPHGGEDMPAPAGTPVLAAGAGFAKPAPTSWAGPNAVLIQHPGGYWTYYAHMQSNNLPKAGKQVAAGEIIGEVGNMGNSYGAHLHIELRTSTSGLGTTNGAVDPDSLLPLDGSAVVPVVNTADPCAAVNETSTLGGTCAGAPNPYSGPLLASRDPVTPAMENLQGQLESICGDNLPGPLAGACDLQPTRGTSSGHRYGVACDVFPKGATPNGYNCSDTSSVACTSGYNIANWLVQYRSELKIKYVIYDDSIWSSTANWTKRPYNCAAGPTNSSCDNTSRHRDHVHVSVEPGP